MAVWIADVLGDELEDLRFACPCWRLRQCTANENDLISVNTSSYMIGVRVFF